MSESERARSHRRSPSEEAGEAEVVESRSSDDEATDLDDVDALLDEIDAVLEDNAEDFVRNYVQKGGQ